MATKKNTVEEVNIKPIEIKTVVLKIEGDSPLIMHAWSEKAKKMMLDAFKSKYAIIKNALSAVFAAIEEV
jgi:hypothetical protein